MGPDWSRAGDTADLLTVVMMTMVMRMVVVVLVIIRLLRMIGDRLKGGRPSDLTPTYLHFSDFYMMEQNCFDQLKPSYDFTRSPPRNDLTYLIAGLFKQK